MRTGIRLIMGACLGVVTVSSPVYSEVWDFNCTEAVSLLKNAQDRVVKKHDQLQEAKFSLRHTPRKFDGCSGNRRGFQGAEIHCVKHRSSHGNVLRDILVAQRSLESAILEFEKQLEGTFRQCQISKP